MDIIEERIIKENAGLIWKLTERFYGIDKKDLFQAGALGMIKAYRNYKKNGTTKFSTYAHDYIYGEMYTLANNKEIKVSKDLKRLAMQIEKMRFRLAQKFERIPTNQEIAEYLEMDVEKIEQALLSASVITSIDDQLEDERSLHETIACDVRVDEDDKILLESSMEQLKPLEKDIINARYFEDLTQSETAKKLGITQVMVSRYETKSLDKMREFMYM